MSNFLLLIFSAICSAFVLWKIAPHIFGEKKAGTIYEKFIYTLSKEDGKRKFQRALNTTPEKAILIGLVNFGILFACLAASVYLKDPDVFKYLIVYVMIGLIGNGYLRVVKTVQVAGLNFISRFEIRLFNAWFFPIYIFAALMKSITSGKK
jgi:hypothetical protein